MTKLAAFLTIMIWAFVIGVNQRHGLVDVTYIGVCLILVVSHIRLVNTVSLACMLLIVKLVELCLFSVFYEQFNAYALYLTYILVDFTLMVAIYLRVPAIRGIMRRFTLTLDDNKWFITNADLLLSLTQLVHVMVGVLMLLEHILRHFLHVDSLVIYNNFELMELTIASFEFLAIMSAMPCCDKGKRHIEA